jgi:hypothetical protein
MECQAIRRELALYRELDAAERERLSRHLAGCAACAATLAAYQQQDRLLGSLPVVRPSPALSEAVRARTVARPRREWRLGWVFATAALGLLLALGLGRGAVTLAGGALPGEPLYVLKRGAEQVQLALTRHEQRDAFQQELVLRRQQEVREVVQHGSEAEVEFQGTLQASQDGTWVVAGLDVMVTADSWSATPPEPGSLVWVTAQAAHGRLIALRVRLVEPVGPAPAPGGGPTQPAPATTPAAARPGGSSTAAAPSSPTPGAYGPGAQPSTTPGGYGPGAQPSATPGSYGPGAQPSSTPGGYGPGPQPSATPTTTPGGPGAGPSPTTTRGDPGAGPTPSMTPGGSGPGPQASETPDSPGSGPLPSRTASATTPDPQGTVTPGSTDPGPLPSQTPSGYGPGPWPSPTPTAFVRPSPTVTSLPVQPSPAASATPPGPGPGPANTITPPGPRRSPDAEVGS